MRGISSQPVEAGEGAPGGITQGAQIGFADRIGADKALGEAHDARLHRVGRDRTPIRNRDYLGRATAGVEGEPVAQTKGVGRPDIAVVGFFLGANNAEIEAGCGVQSLPERRLVGRLADGARTDRNNLFDAGTLTVALEHPQRVHRTPNGLSLKAVRRTDTLGQTHHLAHLVGQAKTDSRLVSHDNQAGRIRA